MESYESAFRQSIPQPHRQTMPAQEVCMTDIMQAGRLRSLDVRSFESCLASTARSKLAGALRSQSRL